MEWIVGMTDDDEDDTEIRNVAALIEGWIHNPI